MSTPQYTRRMLVARSSEIQAGQFRVAQRLSSAAARRALSTRARRTILAAARLRPRPCTLSVTARCNDLLGGMRAELRFVRMIRCEGIQLPTEFIEVRRDEAKTHVG